MFKITHYTNSFISIDSVKSSIICDPWIGTTTDNGWFSYPIIDTSEINDKVFKAKYIYISHLHCDHADPKTLKKFRNKSLTFIIKKFKNGVLKKRLQRLFPDKKIIELDPYKKFKLNEDFTIIIVPQIMSNSSNLEDNIQYDMDTSILIKSNRTKQVFYNNVDMPINSTILKKIIKISEEKLKSKINIFCCSLGAACEFPQSFLNINRSASQKKLINESLSKLNRFLKTMKPEYFFPAGGTYGIYGKFHKLNKYIAQPSFNKIKQATSKLDTKVINIIGGGNLSKKKYDYNVNETKFEIAGNLDAKIMKKMKKLNYYYVSKNNRVSVKNLDINFEKAKLNYFRILKGIKSIKTKWDIYFNIYKNFEINDQCKIDTKKSKYLKTYKLSNNNSNSNNKYKLECFLEYQLFESLLKGRFPWNTSLTGSTIMYKRNPNIFNVDLQFSLNFLRS